MKIENLDPVLQFAIISMLKTAIDFKENGKDKCFFVKFAEEIWETMELNDKDYLKEVILEKMEKDLEPYVEDYMSKKKKE